MPGVYDRLGKALEINQRENGISPLDLADLPPVLRRLMRLMLREVALKYTDLCSRVADLPPAERLTPPELEAALQTLLAQNWLSRYGEGEFVSYRVNLRRRAGSQLRPDIWSALEAHIHNASGDNDV